MHEKLTVAFIGLGEMGDPMAGSLVAAGYRVRGHDLRPAAGVGLRTRGGEVVATLDEALDGADVACSMLPSSEAFVELAEADLLPRARAGQVFVELGTTRPAEVRRLAKAFEARGATLLDVPVSGGRGGAEKRSLRMFAGGDRVAVERLRPLFAAMGGELTIYYCGPAGQGSVMKGVNQLKMGLSAAIHLEILSYARHEGLDLELIDEIYRQDAFMSFCGYPQKVRDGKACEVGVKFRELPYYLADAGQVGYRLPLTEALYKYCDQGKRVVEDDHRPAPSFWHELMRDEG